MNFAAPVAHADPRTYAVTKAATTTALAVDAILVGSDLDTIGLIEPSISVRIKDDTWFHVRVGVGQPYVNAITASAQEALAGAELRVCSATGHACFLSGLDLGVAHQVTQFSLDSRDVRLDAVIEPRLGFEVGTDAISLHGAVGARDYVTLDGHPRDGIGLSLQLGLVTRF